MKVLVVTARGLQVGAIGAYGNAWIETPALDALAAGGIVFDQHYVDAADPAGARRAWRQGRYALPGSPALGHAPSKDLLDILREKQVHTVLIVDQSRPAPPEFAAGWDEIAFAEADDDGSALEVALDIARVTLEELAERDNWLLWLDLATLLPPWELPAEFLEHYFGKKEGEEGETETEAVDEAEQNDDVKTQDDVEPVEEWIEQEPLLDPPSGPLDPLDDALFLRLQSTYAAAVTYLDAAIAELLEALGETGLDDETVVIVTSDAGQTLGEHGIVGPVRPWLHEEVIHLPLIVRLPIMAEAGRHVAGFTQAVDLAPTLAQAFGTSLPHAHGLSLWPLLHGQVEQPRDFAVAGLQIEEGIEWCLRTPEWAFLLPVQPYPDGSPRDPQLFVKPDDRCEVNDVRQQHPDLMEELEKTLRAFVAGTADANPPAAKNHS